MEIKKNSKTIIISFCLAVSLGFCVYNLAQFLILPNVEQANLTLENVKNDLGTSLKLENYDELTQTLNRDGFEAIFSTFLEGAKKSSDERYVALYILNFSSDTKGLKAINDEYGHLVGDNLPITFANHLKEVFSENRFVFARRSGSSFIVFDTEYQGKDDALAYIKKMKEVWHDTPYKVNDERTIQGLALHAFCLPFDAQRDSRSAKELIDYVCDAVKDARDATPFTFTFDSDKTPIKDN